MVRFFGIEIKLEESTNATERWLDTCISIGCPKELEKILAKKLNEYAEDLGWQTWKYEEVKETDRKGRIGLAIHPNNRKGSRSISPKELLIVKDKLLVFEQQIRQELGIEYLEDKQSAEIIKSGNDYTYELQLEAGILYITYDIVERIRLEQHDKQLAINLFGEEVKDFIKREKKKKYKKSSILPQWIKGVEKLLHQKHD